jgi:hypothetical protein
VTRGNLALVRSEERGLPVRVIRGAHRGSPRAPATGYRYDGLYAVSEHWSEPSVNGPLVWRFVLEKADGGTAWQQEQPAATPAAPTGEEAPSRAQSVTQRVIRNSAVTQWVNQLYDHPCQVCGIRLEVDGGAYAEGAHIRALGRPHDGPDVIKNVLRLCPNDHVLFDKGAIYIDGGKVHGTTDRSVLRQLRRGGNSGYAPPPGSVETVKARARCADLGQLEHPVPGSHGHAGEVRSSRTSGSRLRHATTHSVMRQVSNTVGPRTSSEGDQRTWQLRPTCLSTSLPGQTWLWSPSIWRPRTSPFSSPSG